ncbi:helix-turn-helix domain-containing protein [Methylorubrum suomiense]|uniref:HTH-type transcriptional activator RhaS n=1 Tax=Methylorubrum suomiense TaxID=144191 RepID=A0ABQ4V1I6_9HYPH|nr:helix-turn-helix domain-containing protein [Methylorubrum suomiense]GJE78450.1 HTH-type transcriptional activator RhaS [Methylorubrum suomiense]
MLKDKPETEVLKLGLQRFSTAALPLRDRHEAWLHQDWPSFAPFYRCVPLEPFDVTADRLYLDNLLIIYSKITSQEWARDVSLIKSWSSDSLVVALTIQGEAKGTWGDIDVKTRPGSLHLADLAKNSSHVSSASQTIILIVPRALAASRGLDVAALHGVAIASHTASFLTTHLLSLRSAVPELPRSSGMMLARGVIDLLVLALAGTGRASQALVGRRGLALLARGAIDEGLGSPSLNTARLCRTLAVSRATLYRLFEEEGGVQYYIRRRRLEVARATLEDATSAEPICAIAERFGFSDAAHLSRLFRRQYGMTPSDCRAEAQRIAKQKDVQLR